MGTDTEAAPKVWRGRFYEDVDVGDVYRSRFGRTVSEYDNLLFTCLTLNTNSIHFDADYASKTRFGQILVNSVFTLALITGMTVADTSENALANLEWTDIKLPNPVFVGDTLWAETEVVDTRDSSSRVGWGIVTARTRGINQRGEVVIEFRRVFMLPSREHASAVDVMPEATDDWRV